MTLKLQLQSDLSIINETSYFSVVKCKIVEDRFFRRLIKVLDSDFSKKHILKIIDYVKDKIDKSLKNVALRKIVISLGNRVVSLFFSNSTVKKAIILLDRFLANIREGNSFLLKDNQKLFKKWQFYGFKKEIFYKYPEFSNFLFDSFLASQMKITKDGIKEIYNEPAILVEGKWTKFSEIKKRFFFKKSAKYKEVFVFEKDTNQVFCYLPNKKGLCQHHPYLDAYKPVGLLTDKEYCKVLQKAHMFERNYKFDKKDYKHVLQIVTSTSQKNLCFYNNSNLFEFFRTKHPYIRIIDADTKNVYILGYGIWQFNYLNFLTNFIGRFRSLDLWEYKKCKEKIVTNISLNEEEKKKLLYYCKKFINDDIYFGEKIAFNFMKQNCTSFIKEVVHFTIGEKIIIDLKIDEVIYFIIPDFIRNLVSYIKKSIVSIKKNVIKIFPRFIHTYIGQIALAIYKVWNTFITFCLSIIASIFLAIKGIRARKLENPDKNISLYPPLRNIYNWFDYSSFKFDTPGKLKLWQLKQKSSVIFKNPTTLTIVSN